MSQDAQVYRISGHYVKVKTKIPFVFECRALKVEDALEKAYSDIGSRHRVKRDRIFIERDEGVEHISPEDAKNPEFLEMDDPSFKIYR